MPEIQMPKLSDTMTEGTLVAWKKKKGDKVSTGDVIAEIETDKATMEWESPEDGTLTEIYVEEGGKVEVGQRIAFIGEPGEGGEKEKAPKAEEAPKSEEPKEKPKETEKPAPAEAKEKETAPPQKKKAVDAGVPPAEQKPERPHGTTGRSARQSFAGGATHRGGARRCSRERKRIRSRWPRH